MSKGRRNRQARAGKPAASPLQQAVRLDKRVRWLCVFALIAAVLTALVQLWTLTTVNANLTAAIYTAEETSALNRSLPLGWFGVVLMPVGALLALLILRRHHAKWALLFVGMTVLAGVLYVLFALGLYGVFAYNPLKGRGLTVVDLLVRHFSTLLTPVLLLIAAVINHFADKQRAIADMMAAADDTPTVSLGEPTES